MNDRDRLRLHTLLGALEEGLLSDTERNELTAILKSSDTAQQIYLEYMGLSSSLAEYTAERLTESDDPTTTALAELARLHDEGLKQPVRLRMRRKKQAESQVFSSGVHRRLSTRVIAMGSLAAVIALAGLTAMLISYFNQPEPESAEQLQADTLAVATLTAIQDTRWQAESGAVAPNIGDAFYPGQELVLTEGFAEVTTAQGAVAILEAPATIEFTESDNALLLHEGKLVGICETESSKGFLVRTPQLAITDLGTRFGVDSTQGESTEVHVFDGEVAVKPTSVSSAEAFTRVIGRDEAVRVAGQTADPIEIKSDRAQFSGADETVIELPATGLGVAKGEGDSNWLIVAREGERLDKPLIPRAVKQAIGRDGLANDPATSQWIQWYRTERPDDLNETYLFETRINVPDEVDLTRTRLTINCASDNRLLAVHVNGQRIEMPKDPTTFEMRSYMIDRGLISGGNTIAFEVENVWPKNSTTDMSNAVSLRVMWQLRTQTFRAKK